MTLRPLVLIWWASVAFAQPADFHQRAFVFDGHVHMIEQQFYHGGDLGDRYPGGQVDLARIRQGGVDAIFFSLYSREEYYPRRFETKQTLRLIELTLEQVEKNKSQIELALKASDIERINKAGKIAGVLDLEGGFDLDGDLLALRAFHRLGLRSAMVAAHNFTNDFADSCCAPAKWGGLNEQGRRVIREMNRLGMMINVAHGSNEMVLQAVEASSDPVLFTHGGSRHFVDTPRNLSDEAARKIAAKGGVIGLQFGNTMNNRRYFESRQKGGVFGNASEALKQAGPLETIAAVDREAAKSAPLKVVPVPEEIRMPVEQLVEVIDHWVRLVGDDHVSLGSDFDGGPPLARGMHDIRDYPQITAALFRKGYSEQRIRKILGLNLLRVFRQVSER